MSWVFGEGLPHRVMVYVPGTTEVNQELSESAHKEVVNRTKRFLGTLFGGATAIPATGSWLADDGELVSETVTLVYAATGELSTDILVSVREFASGLCRELGQETIAVEVDGELFFVD